MLNIYLNVKDKVTNRQCRISYRRPPQLLLSRPCGSIAYPLPNIFQLVDMYRSVFPASCTVVEWTSSRTGHRSLLVALDSPSCNCTSLPSWDESSFQARRFSLARSGSFVLPLGRGRR